MKMMRQLMLGSVVCFGVLGFGCVSDHDDHHAGHGHGGELSDGVSAVGVAGKRVVVLVGHGTFPTDAPPSLMKAAYSGGHGHGAIDKDSAMGRIMNWPRTPKNDPYFYGIKRIAEGLSRDTGEEVIFGFNEFCLPTTNDVIDEAVASGASEVIVITVMTTPGGGHSEHDIKISVENARKKHKDVKIVNAWPFQIDNIAGMLGNQVRRFR